MKTIYNTETGMIRLCGTFDDEAAAFNKKDGESVYDGYVDARRYKIIDNELVRLESTFDIFIWIREQRRFLLESSDWTQTTDSPLTAEQRTEWQLYRQELRDLPSKYLAETTREEVVFPDPPA